jgi:CheY-like chemotaxis protein/predicted transcriptional regulator
MDYIQDDQISTESTSTLRNIHKSFANPETLEIFNTLEEKNYEVYKLIEKTGINRREFHSLISPLVKMNMVKRDGSVYSITSLGKVFLYTSKLQKYALSNYWRLSAIDMLKELSLDQRINLIESIVDDKDVKRILITPTTQMSSEGFREQVLANNLPTANNMQNGPNIMLVDDDPDILLSLKLMLEGYNVSAFDNSYEALKELLRVGRQYYNLVILDIKMPGINGLQLYQRMKAVDKSIKVAFLSGLDLREELVGLLPGVNTTNILSKPIERGHLLERISDILNEPVDSEYEIVT